MRHSAPFVAVSVLGALSGGRSPTTSNSDRQMSTWTYAAIGIGTVALSMLATRLVQWYRLCPERFKLSGKSKGNDSLGAVWKIFKRSAMSNTTSTSSTDALIGTRMGVVKVTVSAFKAAVDTILCGSKWSKQTKNGTQPPPPSIESNRRLAVPPLLWKTFEEAAHCVHQSNPTLSISQRDQLKLYGLYQQIVDGDAPEDFDAWRRLNITPEEHAAWSKRRDMSIDVAIATYIVTVKNIVSPNDSSSWV